MGIFQRIKKLGKNESEEKDKQYVKNENEEALSAESFIVAPKVKAARFSFTLTSPRISEKAAFLSSKGTYVFNVPVTANKTEIGKAVEALYKVDVVAVRTMRGLGKVVRKGKINGRRNRWKKALVTIKAGQKIELYKGV